MDNRPYIYPRTVKAPRPWQETTMEFETARDDYNVAEFHDNFGHTLPKIVMVNQGFCGDIIQDTFDRQQIMRLHTVSKQKRVIARFTSSGQKRLVSIPVTYEMKMCVQDKKGKPGKEQSLSVIVKENTLPVFVQFPQDKTISIGNQTISSNWIPKMELVQTFDEMYFLSNFIIDGVLVSEVTPVPLYLKQLRLIEVTGIRGQPKDKWTSYSTQLGLACEKIHYDLGFGNSEVAMYDPSANYTDTTYSYVEPTIYSPMHSFFKKPTFGNPSYTITEEPEEVTGYLYRGADVYEEIREASGPVTRTSGNTGNTGSQLNSELKQRIGAGQQTQQLSRSVAVSPPVAPKPVHLQTASSGQPALPERKPTRDFPATASKLTGQDNAYSNVATKFIAASASPKTEPGRLTRVNSTNRSHVEMKQLSGSEDVAKLTIDELGGYMNALNLGHYMDKFRDEMIDGSLLLELDKTVLKEDFGMKGVEAIRLDQFAKTGHIPR